MATDASFTSFVPGYTNLNVGNVTTFTVMGLTFGTTYYYRVRASNDCGTSANSNTITVTTAACLFCKAISGGSGDEGFSIIQTSDGGYAICGVTVSFGAGNGDVYVVKLDGSGNLQWTKTIGGGNNDYGYSIIQTSDGGYAIGGYTLSFGGGKENVYVVKLDGSGNLQWTKTIGGLDLDIGHSIIQTSDGGYAICGYTYSFGGLAPSIYVVKLDGSGNLCPGSCQVNSGGMTGSGGGTSSGGTTTSPIPTVNTGGNVGSGGTLTTICP